MEYGNYYDLNSVYIASEHPINSLLLGAIFLYESVLTAIKT